MSNQENPKLSTIINYCQFDRGPISPINNRLDNHISLSSYFPNYFPQVIIPDSTILATAEDLGKFPVEAIQGKNWQELGLQDQLEPVRHLEIGVVVFEQLITIIEQTGILLKDRQPQNMIVTPDNKIVQVDTQFVYDLLYQLPGIQHQELSLAQRLKTDLTYFSIDLTVSSLNNLEKETNRVLFGVKKAYAFIGQKLNLDDKVDRVLRQLDQPTITIGRIVYLLREIQAILVKEMAGRKDF